MKRTVNPLLVFAFVVLTITSFHACKKNSEEECHTCKAIGPDNNIVDEEQVCNEAQETAFRNKNAGKEIICN